MNGKQAKRLRGAVKLASDLKTEDDKNKGYSILKHAWNQMEAKAKRKTMKKLKAIS